MFKMFDYYDFDTEVPDMDTDRIQEDFSRIFSRNAFDVELIKHLDQDTPEKADFFGTKTQAPVHRNIIKLFITSNTSDTYRRTEHGIVTNEATFQAYAQSTVEINNNDFIRFLRTTQILNFYIKRHELFIVQDHNRPIYKGQYCWQEFRLKRVDHERK